MKLRRTGLATAGLTALTFLFIGSQLFAGTRARAQSPLQQVLDLNRQAMNAYMNLELEQAEQFLQQALQAAERGRVTGTPLARTYINLGVVAIGGFGDNGRGLQHFTAALRADPNAQLDPLTATPEMTSMFELAQRQAGSGGPSPDPGPDPEPGPSPPQPTAASGNIPHQAVPEQLVSTAVPVYVEVEGSPSSVYLYYRAQGMREFRRVEMQSVGGGYGFEIPCSDVFEPSVEYYIVAFGRDGSPLGFAGSQSDPVSVPIVSSRTQSAPALPGRAPPEQCREQECPPGMSGCESRRGGAGLGGTCRVDNDCNEGLSCDDGICLTDERGGGGGPSEPSDGPSFFIHISGGLGLGFASPGMQADSFPMAGNDAAFVEGRGPGTECELDDGFYCVRVSQSGFVPNFILRFAAGWYFHERVGVAVFGRIQPISGSGDLAFGLFGARIQAQLTDPVSEGLHAHAFLGVSVGQVQLQPPGNGPDAPWIISGLWGVPVGTVIGYRLMENFGFIVTTELMFQFPTFLFNIDLAGGIEISF